MDEFSSAKFIKQRNSEIEKILKEDAKKLQRTIKLLLLGAGESGKSTIVKQMKIINMQGFDQEDRLYFKKAIHRNIIEASQSLIRATEKLSLSISQSNQDFAQKILSIELASMDVIPSSFMQDLKSFWEDSAISTAYSRRNEFQLIDSVEYYFANLERMLESQYIPDEQDILRARVRTTGIAEIDFDIQGLTFKLVDVGGQRSERRKWMHCFSDVTAAIFVVSLSEYNQKLMEDEDVNRMAESLKLLHEVSNSKWLKDTSIILFLNKVDLFQEKIQRVDLNVCFPEYTGGKDSEKALTFIKEKFMATNLSPHRAVYPYVTCATDTKAMEQVWAITKDIIIRGTIDDVGF